ncbi:MAG TPA: SusC/RagA family TonB-linked outer membrane protein [Cyclobacteriaceae bacterium]|nr:SusC/RagA family TonB-linked outer membrane protein [Cyclobacteriaceae bacterium]
MRKTVLIAIAWCYCLLAVAQDRTISGKVISVEDKTPLPGVNVLIKGSVNGTVTDAEGKYTLSIPSGNVTLIFTFIGLKSEEVEVGDRTIIDAQLTSDVTQLHEVVVTALGEKVDRDKFASSVSTVTGGNIARSGETGVLQGLSGKAAGVLITRSGGDPGAGAYIQIRGQNTINGNAQPLFIVDGVPVSNSNEGTTPTGGPLAGAGNAIVMQSRINDINPDDIASMEVLKGASAAALWGTRAANGVIIITTKRGMDSKGKVNVSFKSTYSVDEVNKMHELQTTYGQGINGRYVQGNRETWGDKISDRTGGPDTYITNPSAPGYAGFVTFPDGSRRYAIASGTGTSWDGKGAAAHGGKNSQDTYDHRYDAFQKGHYTDNNMTISGGNNRTTFLVSYSNLAQKGIVKGFSDYKRNSARFNASSQFTDWFRASASAAYVNSYSTRIQGGDNLDGLLLGGIRTSPDFDNSQYLGDYTSRTGAIALNRHVSFRNPLGASENPRYSNPLWNINNNKNTTNVDRFIGNVELSADPLSWLNITGRAGIDHYTDKNKETFPVYSASFVNGMHQVNVTTESQLNTDLFARASKQFGENFSGTLLVGVNYNDRSRETDHTQVTGFVAPSAPDNLNNGLNSNLSAYVYRTHIRTFAYYGSADLQAYDMLFLTLTGRAESASTYANSFFFPSAALGWQFSKLDALQNSSAFSFGKLRLTWGQVGIQPQPYLGVTAFPATSYIEAYAETIAASSAVYGGGYTQSLIKGNPNLKPETKTETEAGFDLRFLDNRLSLSATAYYSRTKDVILTLNVSEPTGYQQQNRNAAILQNKGIELEMGYDVIKKGAFTWNVGGNFSLNRNKIVSLSGSSAQLVPGNGTYGGQSLIEGQPFGVFYGTDFLKDEATGAYRLDANGFPQDGIQNEVIGNPNPMWRAGMSTTASFKGLSLYVLFDKVYGNDYWNGTRGAIYTFGTHKDNGVTSVAPAGGLKTYDGQTIPAGQEFRGQIKDFGGGPVALTQSWYQGPGTSFNQSSNKQFVENGGSTRLREITASYSLNGQAFKRATRLQSIDFSITGRNVFLWTKYTGVDPETNISGASLARGSDWFTNPSTKSWLFSVKITY